MAVSKFRRRHIALAFLALTAVASCDQFASSPPLIPRKTFFSEPTRYQIRLSPDGELVSFLAPVGGVMALWLAPRSRPMEGRALPQEPGKFVVYHQWMADGHRVLIEEGELGTETLHLVAFDAKSGERRNLTPFRGVQARLIAWSFDRPDEVLVGINSRNVSWHDVYRVRLSTGSIELVEKNPGFAKYIADNDLRLRYGVAPARNGGLQVYERWGNGWRPWQSVPPEDALGFHIVDFDRANKHVYLIDSRGRDRAVLTKMAAATGATQVLAADPDVDLDELLVDPLTSTVQAFAVTAETRIWKAIDPSIAEDLRVLSANAGPDGTIDIVSRTRDDRNWVVHIGAPTRPGVYHIYDRATAKFTPLPTRPEFAKLHLQPMHAARFAARDGLPLLAYYTLAAGQARKGKPTKRAPLVVAVHSGPWARDKYGFNAWHQWLANRGYAVMSVNYRGSTGFGKAFLNAADGEWGRAMQSDLADAVRWAIDAKIADPKRVAIMGSQYGGYAVLAGLAFSPETYACGVSFGGPSNLVHMVQSLPPYWIAMRDIFLKRVGDPATPDGRTKLEQVSPALNAERIEKPLLIAQGLRDPMVSESDTLQLVQAMEKRSVPVTYIRYPDEMGKLSRPSNMISFYAITEAFLGKCLGGRVEPIAPDLAGSSVEIMDGAAHVPGLIEAMSRLTRAPAP